VQQCIFQNTCKNKEEKNKEKMSKKRNEKINKVPNIRMVTKNMVT
jgi:hypothetical protein